jgi:hypothetical protein
MRLSYFQTTKQFIDRTKERAAADDSSFTAAARQEVKDMVYGYMIYYAALVLLILGMLSILSFTDLLGGPFLLAQILLFLFGGTVVLMVIALWWLWSKIKHKLSEMQGMHKADDVREATVVDGRLDNQ